MDGARVGAPAGRGIKGFERDCTMHRGSVFGGQKHKNDIEPLFYPVKEIQVLEKIFLLFEDLQVLSADNEISIVNIFQ
jgi:hypothetical protein